MKPNEIEKIHQLDPNGMSGTIQSVLMNSDINKLDYPSVIYYLLVKTLEERNFLEKDNKKLINILMSNGLYTDDVLNLGGN